ncbi:hypothetical protein HMPREF0497_0517 [Lentilactobacillus buchneri ATCC 11577]|nr:hypothetical protein HMPREF0497_0517 [Lentilactobacillus buchneri ATCC 11577]
MTTLLLVTQGWYSTGFCHLSKPIVSVFFTGIIVYFDQKNI